MPLRDIGFMLGISFALVHQREEACYRKFAQALLKMRCISDFDKKKELQLARSPQFKALIAELLREIYEEQALLQFTQ